MRLWLVGSSPIELSYPLTTTQRNITAVSFPDPISHLLNEQSLGTRNLKTQLKQRRRRSSTEVHAPSCTVKNAPVLVVLGCGPSHLLGGFKSIIQELLDVIQTAMGALRGLFCELSCISSAHVLRRGVGLPELKGEKTGEEETY